MQENEGSRMEGSLFHTAVHAHLYVNEYMYKPRRKTPTKD